MPSGAPDAARRSSLNAAKLDALVAAHWGADGDRGRHAFGSGAALTGELDDEPVVLGPRRRTGRARPGPALLWAERQGAARLHLVLDDAGVAGVLARQAELFAPPAPGVWRVVERDLEAAAPAKATAAATPPVPPELVDLLHDAGLELVVEDGLVRGELNGLEVARIVGGLHDRRRVPRHAPARGGRGQGRPRADRHAPRRPGAGRPAGPGGRDRPRAPPAGRRTPPPQPTGARALAAGGAVPRAAARRAGDAAAGAGRPPPHQPA